ncbi:hypothetical protein NLI96_g8342 [Meripilus lineatus]|uniref:Uncharacterized protein n=1 Tax=Meripilus lineatus TaxID=2056292 RepID=A0AAD5YGB1_9APHY|nr:hypothetical protein NLI96_g8342 [Physisporinus lineatus]
MLFTIFLSSHTRLNILLVSSNGRHCTTEIGTLTISKVDDNHIHATACLLFKIARIKWWGEVDSIFDNGLWTSPIQFIDTVSAILVTRFILSLRSHGLPKSNVPGEFPSLVDQSAWSSRLVFLNKIKSIDLAGDLGGDLDHDEDDIEGPDEESGSTEAKSEPESEGLESIGSEVV